MKKSKHIVWLLGLLMALPLSAQTDSINYPLDTTENGEVVYKYQVEKSIGLYRIGVNFGVPQSEIVRMNPQLQERGLRFGETLLIPTGRKVEKKTIKTPLIEREHKILDVVKEMPIMQLPVDTIRPASATNIASDSVPAEKVADSPTIDSSVTAPRKPLIELALMLPFESGQPKQSQNAERIMAFYQGVLLAMHDSQNDSTRYRLRVFDTGRSERVVNDLCDSTLLDSVQAVLGLAYPIQVERMATWCRIHDVPLLVPFSSDIDLLNQPNVLQFNSSDQQAADSLCHWMQSHESLHCVVVETDESETAAAISTLRNEMQAQGIRFSRLPIEDLMNDSADYILDITRENLMILPSDRFQHIRRLVPHLEALQRVGYRIRLVGQYSWQKEHLDLPMIYTSVFTSRADHSSYDALWNRYYAGEFVSETPRYDLLGYDLMHALLAWLQGQTRYDGLQSVIEWQRVGDGGWQNGGMRVVEK
ncbi:MAG: hypothetical protein J5761_04000 [Paludibacteraceae bacterium]|nr:hypothetical protein [Paludibacteraceae bacterium]